MDVKHRLGTFELEASFRSDAGVTALFGRSGSGKTAILRIIAGLDKPQAGSVSLGEDVLSDAATNQFVPKHRRRFGYVFQEARLFPHLSVRQNLTYGRWFAPKAGRTDKIDGITELLGISALMDRAPGNLSGGEKQRVAIGRALLSSPRMLLMDEPLAALDEDRKEEILPYLERLRDRMKIPIVYVSHSVAEVARLADCVIVVSEGKVAAVGNPSEVISHQTSSSSTNKREAGVLLEGILAEHNPEYRLNRIALKTTDLLVPGVQYDVGRRVRVQIPARDVMLATSEPIGLSALNVLRGTVVSISEEPTGTVNVRVDFGGDIILSRITKLSCERLQLGPGKQVYAIIKTLALEYT